MLYALIDCSGVIKYVSTYVYAFQTYFCFPCSVNGGCEEFVRESSRELVYGY